MRSKLPDKKKKFNFPLNGCGTGQAYDCGYMKKLSRTQLKSTRSIHLVISERGTIIIYQQGPGLQTYEPRCQQEIHMGPMLFQKGKTKSVTKLALGKSTDFRQTLTGVLPIQVY